MALSRQFTLPVFISEICFIFFYETAKTALKAFVLFQMLTRIRGIYNWKLLKTKPSQYPSLLTKVLYSKFQRIKNTINILFAAPLLSLII